jgi:DDE family transposase
VAAGLHGSARTTPRVRAELQASQESTRALAARHGLNPKTVAKWRGRAGTADAPTGPRRPRSTVLTEAEEAIVVEFRRRTLLGANATQTFNSWTGKPGVAGTAEEIAEDLEPAAWQRLSAGEGTQGPRLSDWAYLELADLEAEEYEGSATGLWTRGLLIRRSLTDGERAYFTTWCPAGTTIETLAAVEGRRWAIEDAFETAKNEFGLDHNETRSWHGWHRHVSLVMLAFAMLATIRRRANAPPPKTPIRLTRTRRTSSAGRSRRSGASPSASPSVASGQPTSSPGRSGDARTRPPRDART